MENGLNALFIDSTIYQRHFVICIVWKTFLLLWSSGMHFFMENEIFLYPDSLIV